MVVWLKDESGRTVRLVDRWTPSIFIATDNLEDMAIPLQAMRQEFAWTRTTEKYEQVTDSAKSTVTEAKLKDAKSAQRVGLRMERMGPFGAFRLYNVDVPPNQSYLYEHDIFPLARCEVTQDGGGLLTWKLDDDAGEYDYYVPTFTKMKIDVLTSKQGKIARVTDSIKEIRVDKDGEKIAVDGGSEVDKILELVSIVRSADPDFVITDDGDTFLLPYLVKRAESNGVADRFSLDREGTPMKTPAKGGTSYFSYGKIYYKPSAMKLLGRVHVDTSTSFAFREAGFEGLFELSRVCRMPMHTSSRASIGKALSSLQFYHASKSDLLVPWKPTLWEHFKDRNELMIADRGGFIFEPRIGVHERVAELDFSALYPNIMLRKNISAETIRCQCCPDSKNRVPELGWNVCERTKGIVPKAIEIIVRKRLRYKELASGPGTGTDRARYDARQGVLKWLGVTTFGYLGFNNAKFGRIDAHIAVCAWDRKILLDAAKIAEAKGFDVVHGIIDSLWLRKDGEQKQGYLELKSEIERETGFVMSFNGIFNWVVFLPSKVNPSAPSVNRYFGVFSDGVLKVRGIEARRHDTPLALAKCQMDVLQILAGADSISAAKDKVPQCLETFLDRASALARHEIPSAELAFTTDLSKEPEEYSAMTVQRAAVRRLVEEGATLHAGEGIRYIITDYEGTGSRRVIPLEMVEGEVDYDSDRYIALLARTCASVLEPFDQACTAAGILRTFDKQSVMSLT